MLSKYPPIFFIENVLLPICTLWQSGNLFDVVYARYSA